MDPVEEELFADVAPLVEVGGIDDCSVDPVVDVWGELVTV